MSPRKTALLRLCTLTGCAALAIAMTAMKQQPTPQEAATGFTTPSFDSNANDNQSNGIEEPVGDTFLNDKQVFEFNHSADAGLGPTYNAVACVSCHQNPNTTGGASQTTEVRAGHFKDGAFINPTITINDGQDTITGRSIVNDRAICPQAQEQVDPGETSLTLRAALNTLGDGYVEAVPDSTLLAIAAGQPAQSGGRIHGEAIMVPISEGPMGTTRVGRFGWKDQHGSLLSFAADAYINEIGISNRFHPKDVTTVCKTTTDPEDQADKNGLFAIDHFAQFIRGTQAPPPDPSPANPSAVQSGEKLFTSARLQCSICHVTQLVTAPAGTALNGGVYNVPDALGNRVFHPYSDFLLHNIGTGDGIVQTANYQDSAFKLRTAPLWGLRTKTRFMHDLGSLSLDNAIKRHRVEAQGASDAFRSLSDDEQQDLIAFLNSL